MNFHTIKKIYFAIAATLFIAVPASGFAADIVTSNVVTNYNPTSQRLTVTGVAANVSTVVVSVIDSTGTVKLFVTVTVGSGGVFEYDSANAENPGGAIKVALSNGDYAVKFADYSGGSFATTTLAVTDSPDTTTVATTTATTNPATGDINLYLYILLGLVSGAGIIFLFKKNKANSTVVK